MSNKLQNLMNHSDCPIDMIVHGAICEKRLRCAVVVSTDTTKAAQQRHEMGPMATIALGRALACTALMGSTLKEGQQYVHCQVDGDGPMKGVVAEFIAPASLRGYAKVPNLAAVLTSNDHIPQAVGEALGSSGTVTIKRGSFTGKEPYTGIASLVTGEIAQDIAQYYVESEQIPTIIAAGVKLDHQGKVLAAGGILVQKIGGEDIDDHTLAGFEERCATLNLSEKIASGMTPEEIFQEVAQEDVGTLQISRKPIGFHCFCNRDRMASTMISLGEDELRDILAEVGKLEIRCHYCSSLQRFELSELIKH
ncbi:MAG: Hsp33 family molecular chaperone HslO [Bdellovibrionota bacterium]